MPLAREERALHVLVRAGDARGSRAAGGRCRRRSSPTGRPRRASGASPSASPSRASTRRRQPREIDLVVDDERAQRRGELARGSRGPHPSCRRRPRHRSGPAQGRRARSPPSVRSMPSVSIGSSVGRSPAVSTIVSGMPWISICACTASRVVPAIGVTIATSSPASWLSRLDLPTFGRPTSTTVRPSRSSAPCFARARTRGDLRPRSPRACRARRRRAGSRGPRRENRASPR